MTTFENLTAPRALYVRTIRADGSVSRLYDQFRRSPRVYQGALVLARKGKVFPIVAVSGDIADVRLDQGVAISDDQLDALAPVWRIDAPKAAQAPKGAAAQAPAKGSPEAKAKMAELRAKRGQPQAAQTPTQAPAQTSTQAPTSNVADVLGAIMGQLNALAAKVDANEARMVAFLSAPKPRKRV